MRPPLETISTLLDQGAADSAVRMLRSAWEPEMPASERVPVYCMWIRGLCDTDELDAALVLAQRAAAEFPLDTDILTAFGNVLDLVDDLERAREVFTLAVDIDAENPLAQYNLGAVLDRLGLEDEAKKRYVLSMTVGDDAPAILEAATALGALLRRQGAIDEATEVYERFLEEDPINVEVLVEHGICLSDREDFEDALARFESALAIEPRHAGALYNKAITQSRAGDPHLALITLRQAWETEPDNPLTLAVLGSWLLGDIERVEEALGHLYGAVDRVEAQHRDGEINPAYASLVLEEVFEAMWAAQRPAEARMIAHLAGRHDWVTTHMLDTIAWADNEASHKNNTFTVSARAQADEAATLEHWPLDAGGYTTDLSVVAANEQEARCLTLEYLRRLDPDGAVAFDVRVVRRVDRPPSDTSARPAGVIGVVASRTYFRRPSP
ncbi:MAG: tetratricopeptide repeat protein [Nannocystaceae bacterium]